MSKELTSESIFSSKRKAHMSQIRTSIQAIPLRRNSTLLAKKTSQSHREGEQNKNPLIEDKENSLQAIEEPFQSKYELLNKLGEGTNGVVHRCLRKKTGIQYAVKSFRLEEENLPALKSNFMMMKRLNHPNIIKYQALYIDISIGLGWLVMELVNFPSLQKVSLKTEEEIKFVMVQLLQALNYLHRQDIAHRDIKPENILIDPTTNNIKIIDFGISKRLKRRGALIDMWTITGTLYYRAPEMFYGGYREGVDVWAAGILLFKLVAGQTPFESEYHHQTIQNIQNSKLQFPEKFNSFSHDLKALVGKMLTKNVQERPTVSGCLRDIWFLSLSHGDNKSQKRLSDISIFEQCSRNMLKKQTKKFKLGGLGRPQSLDVSLDEYMQKENCQPQEEPLDLIRPYRQMTNGHEYYCIDAGWSGHS